MKHLQDSTPPVVTHNGPEREMTSKRQHNQ